MIGPYRSEGTRGRCERAVDIPGGVYTSGGERVRVPRILPECSQFRTTVPGVEQPDCSAIATSSAQEEILVGWGCGCDMGIAV